MSQLTVSLGDNSYDILIGSDSLQTLGRRCAERGLNGRVALITNPTVAALYADVVRGSLADAGNSVTVIQIPDGEEHKNSSTLNSVYDALIEGGIDRSSFIVALGGGVVGDLAGYAAATYLRGIPFVQVPTTLLAQVDSSVGGKTAIDHPRGKNLIGAFYQPRLVLVDVETLKTLPGREFRAGLAEVVKYGVIFDRSFFEYLEQQSANILALERQTLEQVILRSCQLKAQVVELDEKEAGLRASLNFGHTLGHAIETGAGYGELVHGEAVAVGMALASRVSMQCGHCTAEDAARIDALLIGFGLTLVPPVVAPDRLMDALVTDKKSRGGAITFICNRGIGSHCTERLLPDRLLALSGLVGERTEREPFGPGAEVLPSVRPAGILAGTPLSVAGEEDFLEDIEIIDFEEADILEEEGDEAPKVLNTVAAAEPQDPLSTATVAELYVQQGHVEKALGIYRALLADDPSNARIQARIANLDAREIDSTAADSAATAGAEPAGSEPAIPPPVNDPAHNRAEDSVAKLEDWLEAIGRIKACR